MAPLAFFNEGAPAHFFHLVEALIMRLPNVKMLIRSPSRMYICGFVENGTFLEGSRTKCPRTKPPEQNPPDKIPLTKSPQGQNPPGQNPPGQNPPIISPQTVPLLNTFCFIEMLFSKASVLPPSLDVIYSMVMKWRSVDERSR